MKVFNDYSKYYNLLYQDKPYEEEANYIDDLIKKYHPSTKSILELGCGTGKHADLLSKKNYLLHGIDISKTMLEEANKISNSQISFAFGDAKNYRIEKKFDTVISLFHVASYQNSNQDLLDFFATANCHLEKNGLFIFDAWYGPAVLNLQPQIRTKTLENDDLKIIRLATPKIDFNSSIVDVNYDITITNKKNNLQHNITETHKMRYLFLNEVDFFLKVNNFKLIESQEFLTGHFPSKDSWGLCFIAKKI